MDGGGSARQGHARASPGGARDTMSVRRSRTSQLDMPKGHRL